MSKETIEKLKGYIENIDNKKVNFYFSVPDIETPSSSINELYFNAKVLHDNGYNVVVLTETEKEPSKWVDSEYSVLKHELINNNKLMISPYDVLVIPEALTNVMEQTKNVPALRVVMLQSIDYMLNSLVIGTDFTTFGIQNVISNSKLSTDIFNYFFKRGMIVKNYKIGIPEYFSGSYTTKKPIISIVSRNSNDITRVIKLFYAKYPEFNWVMFDPLLTKSQPPQFLDRREFAKRLNENFAAIWIDKLSTFGTFPLECMKAGVIPVCNIPDIAPDYYVDNSEELIKSGYWVNNIYNIPDVIAQLITNYLNDMIDEKDYELGYKIVGDYTVENSKIDVLRVYEEFLYERKTFFTETINQLEKNLENE